MYGVGRLRPMSITNYQARKVTHCHINVNVCFWPDAANFTYFLSIEMMPACLRSSV